MAIRGLARRMRELRAARGVTQEAAAEKARIDHKHWQDIEAGVTNPTVATLVGVSKALGVSLAELFAAPPATSQKG